MITASEARSLVNEKPSKAEMETIEAIIKDAAKKGSTSVWSYKQLSPQMKNLLKSSGYTIDEIYDRGDYMVNIKWDMPTSEPGAEVFGLIEDESAVVDATTLNKPASQ